MHNKFSQIHVHLLKTVNVCRYSNNTRINICHIKLDITLFKHLFAKIYSLKKRKYQISYGFLEIVLTGKNKNSRNFKKSLKYKYSKYLVYFNLKIS